MLFCAIDAYNIGITSAHQVLFDDKWLINGKNLSN
jgi:hypothetical protein